MRLEMVELEVIEKELEALRTVYRALHPLNTQARSRVMTHVGNTLEFSNAGTVVESSRDNTAMATSSGVVIAGQDQLPLTTLDIQDRDFEYRGLSAVAKSWVLRHELSLRAMSTIFSFGADHIRVVVKSLPGERAKDKARSIFLLQGFAVYLSSGKVQFGHDLMKETCTHYGIYDPKHTSEHLRAIASEISGNSKSGYALTNRGLLSATSLVRSLSNEAG